MILEKFHKRFRSKLLITSWLFCQVSFGALAQKNRVNIVLKQGRETFNVLDQDSIFIKPKRFEYKLSFPVGGQINLHHSYTDSLFNEFANGQIKNIPDWWAHCMAEESYNSDKELLISNDGWSCWFYDEKTDFYRLDAKSIRLHDGYYTGTKTVRFLYNVKNQSSVSVRDAQEPIYLIVAQQGIAENSVGYAHTCKIIFE